MIQIYTNVQLNATGIWLIVKLHRQIRFALFNINDSSELNDLSPIPAIRPALINHNYRHDSLLHLPPSSHPPASPLSLTNSTPTLLGSPTDMTFDQTQGWKLSQDAKRRGSFLLDEVKLRHVRAMQKLERDLIIVNPLFSIVVFY